MKFYFDKTADNCFQIKRWKEYMKENNLEEIELFEAKMEVGNGYFYCNEYDVIGEVGGSDCGKFCEGYKPRNGKNGRCVHSKNTYEMTDKILILKI